MVKIKDINEVSVRQISPKMVEVSTVYGGYYRHKIYMGYSKKDAIQLFKKALAEGKV